MAWWSGAASWWCTAACCSSLEARTRWEGCRGATAVSLPPYHATHRHARQCWGHLQSTPHRLAHPAVWPVHCSQRPCCIMPLRVAAGCAHRPACPVRAAQAAAMGRSHCLCQRAACLHAALPSCTRACMHGCMQAVFGDVLLIDPVSGGVRQLYHLELPAGPPGPPASAPVPPGRAHAALAVHDDMLYVVGGVRYGVDGGITW